MESDAAIPRGCASCPPLQLATVQIEHIWAHIRYIVLKRYFMLSNDVLKSWLEVAAYMGKGVRTVQRWEVELGLPIHRLPPSHIAAVPQELDSWVHHSLQPRSRKLC
jgi:hypothetical protein